MVQRRKREFLDNAIAVFRKFIDMNRVNNDYKIFDCQIRWQGKHQRWDQNIGDAQADAGCNGE